MNKTTFVDYDTEITAGFLNTLQDTVIGNTSYGTCSTAAGTAAKEVTISDFVLATGATVKVKFTNSNTASAPTLNVNNTGAKAIKLDESTAAGTTPNLSWNSGQIVQLVYDGTNWKIANHYIRGIKASEITEDRGLDTIAFTPNSTYVNNNAVRCRKRGNTVMMQISLSLKALEASTSTYTVGSIPSSAAPPFSINTVLTKINANNQVLLFQVDADGTVKVTNSGTANTSGWFDGSVMWMI